MLKLDSGLDYGLILGLSFGGLNCKCSAAETPRVEVEHRPSPSAFTPLGQKAAGEGAAIPSPAAIASAVENALEPFGVRIRHLPLTPETVWRLIRESQA